MQFWQFKVLLILFSLLPIDVFGRCEDLFSDRQFDAKNRIVESTTMESPFVLPNLPDIIQQYYGSCYYHANFTPLIYEVNSKFGISITEEYTYLMILKGRMKFDLQGRIPNLDYVLSRNNSYGVFARDIAEAIEFYGIVPKGNWPKEFDIYKFVRSLEEKYPNLVKETRSMTVEEMNRTVDQVFHDIVAELLVGFDIDNIRIIQKGRSLTPVELKARTLGTVGKDLQHQDFMSYDRPARAKLMLESTIPAILAGYMVPFGTLENAPATVLPRDHAMNLVGYDKTGKRFLVRNSYGVRWGEDGYKWVNESDLAEILRFISLPKEAIESSEQLQGMLEKLKAEFAKWSAEISAKPPTGK